MPELVKAATPSFYKPASKPGTPSHTFDLKKSWPWVVGFVLFGAGVILFLRSRGSSTTQGPVLSVYPTEAADSSQIDNLIQAVHNLGGVGAGSGATTPVTSGTVDRSAGNGGDATVTPSTTTQPSTGSPGFASSAEAHASKNDPLVKFISDYQVKAIQERASSYTPENWTRQSADIYNEALVAAKAKGLY